MGDLESENSYLDGKERQEKYEVYEREGKKQSVAEYDE